MDTVVQVVNNPDEHRYEVRADGTLAGSTVYRERPGLIVFVHTEIDERFEGQGLASTLIRTALDDARERELQVLPFCPFVNGYIARHREYVELVPEAFRARFGL
jgi:predicted GNAT family acetyltransferase